MRDFTIAIYCFIDDLLQKSMPGCCDKRRKLSDAQIITTVLIGARYFYGNHESSRILSYYTKSGYNHIVLIVNNINFTCSSGFVIPTH